MALNITNDQFLTSTQTIQSRHVRLELLNHEYQTVDEIQGVCINGSFSIDANSDIRRTASINLVVQDTSFDVGAGKKIWLDKYVRVYVGIENIRGGEVVWNNMGIYIVDAPSYSFEPATNSLNLSLLDLMAKLTGARNGYLPGTPVVLKSGENIRKAIIDTLEMGGFTKYVVEEAPFPGVIPIDLEFSQGATVYDLLSGLRDIYPNYEIYFDTQGVFFYKPIPTGKDEPIMMDDSLFDSVITKEAVEVDFQNVKNSIEVYGRTHEPQHFSTETTVKDSLISLTMAGVEAYVEDMIYGFTLTDNKGIKEPKIKINELKELPVKIDDKNLAEIEKEEGEVYYCIQNKGEYWEWLGHLQAYGIAEDTNPDSPFYINGTIGKIRLPLFDGDYANCLSDDLAKQRAEYELWLHTNMNNTITLQGYPIYWLDVNMLVEYTQKRNNKTDQWLIKSLSMGLAPTDTMSINGIKYYGEDTTPPDYEALEYLESTGTQYIDVDVKPTANTRIYIEFEVNKDFTGKGCIAGVTDGTNYFTLVFDGSAKQWYISRYANEKEQAFSDKLNSRDKVVIDKNKNVTTMKEETLTANVPSDGFSIDDSLFLFALDNKDKAEQNIKMKLYATKIYEGENMVRNFIPARRKEDKKLGLYDAVGLKFYENKGTGDFVAGAVKSK